MIGRSESGFVATEFAAGVAVLVNRILPKVEALIARVRAKADK